MDNAITLRETDTTNTLTLSDLKAQVQLIQEVMRAVMQEGFHYGVIPGTEKPTLLKPGAEKLTVTFRLAPKLLVETRDMGAGHREYEVRCSLEHIPTGRVYGEGVGSCSTLESRYRYRTAERICPQCGRSAIIKGKAEYGGGWLCFQKKGGCGAKFAEQDAAITGQSVGKVDNPDIADVYNTVLKMAKKRALVDATLTVTAASDIFTQDLEDFPEAVAPVSAPPPRKILPPTPQKGQGAAPPVADAHDLGGQLLTLAQRETIVAALRERQVSDQGLLAYLRRRFGCEQLSQLPQSTMADVLAWIASQEAATPAPSSPDLITKEQLKLLAMAQQRARIPDEAIHAYLTQHFGIASRKDIQKKDLNAVLDWIGQSHQQAPPAE